MHLKDPAVVIDDPDRVPALVRQKTVEIENESSVITRESALRG